MRGNGLSADSVNSLRVLLAVLCSLTIGFVKLYGLKMDLLKCSVGVEKKEEKRSGINNANNNNVTGKWALSDCTYGHRAPGQETDEIR